MARTTRGASRCHPKRVTVEVGPPPGRRDTSGWTQRASRSADTALDLLDSHVAGSAACCSSSECGFSRDLAAALATGLDPHGLREALELISSRLRRGNLSEDGRMAIRAPSRPAPGTSLDSRHVVHALGLLPGARDLLDVPGPDAFLAAAPTAKGYARLVASVPAAEAAVADLRSVYRRTEDLRADLMDGFEHGTVGFGHLCDATRESAALALRESAARASEIRATLAGLPPTSEQRAALEEFLSDVAHAYDPSGLAPFDLPPERSLPYSEPPERVLGEYRYDDDFDAAASALGVMTEALMDSHRAMMPMEPDREYLLRLAEQELRRSSPHLTQEEVEIVCAAVHADLCRYRMDLMFAESHPFESFLDRPSRYDDRRPSSPEALMGHVDLFVSELQPPGSSGNAAASRRMAGLMLRALADDDGLGSPEALAPLLPRLRRRAGQDPADLPPVPPAVAALAAHLSEDGLEELCRLLGPVASWGADLPREMSTRFGMPLSDAERHVAALAARDATPRRSAG